MYHAPLYRVRRFQFNNQLFALNRNKRPVINLRWGVQQVYKSVYVLDLIELGLSCTIWL